MERREDELRQMAEAGHRCAFVRLMELLVDAGRVDALRAMAVAGDDRAGVTLAEYWVRHGDEAALRQEATAWPRAGLWLAEMIEAREAFDEARDVLVALADNPNASAHHREATFSLLARRRRLEGQ